MTKTDPFCPLEVDFIALNTSPHGNDESLLVSYWLTAAKTSLSLVNGVTELRTITTFSLTASTVTY